MIVYLITNMANGKVYVGKTKQALLRRWSKHKSGARGILEYRIYNAIREHGSDNFELKILHEVQPGEDGDALEQYWVKQYRSNDPEFGYNMTAGGKGMVGYVASDETRAKIGVGSTARIPSEKQRQAVSRAHKGKPKPLEQRIKMAAHWDENRRDEQAEIARRVNAVENAKLKDYVCGNCGKQFTQVAKGVFGGHRKYCLKRSGISGVRPYEAQRERVRHRNRANLAPAI